MPTYKDLTSPKEKTMKHAPLVALALAALLFAGCGGSGSSITADDLAAVEEERDAALEAQRVAERQRQEAERQRQEAERQRQEAERQRQQEQEARQEAEARADDLEEEAGQTADQLVQANARQVYTGLAAFLGGTDIGDADPAITPRYRESALLDTAPTGSNNPDVTFSSITTGTSGSWFRTSFLNRAFEFTDRMDVYTDAEPPKSVSFTSVYNEDTEEVVARYDPSQTTPEDVIDDNSVVGSIQISTTTAADRADASSSLFPRSGQPRKDFDQADRGLYTVAQRTAVRTAYNEALAMSRIDNPTDTEAQHIATARAAAGVDTDILDHTGRFRDQNRYPLQFTAEVGGSLGGASGTFTCASAAEADCRVTNQNNHFRFLGPWVFTPSSAGATVRVDDAEFMYFGWWARQDNASGNWTYRTFHGPTETGANGNRSTAAEISQLTGTATYEGPAVGQYSFYQPLTQQSEYGEFSATATLTADFGDIANTGGTVQGTIDQFDNHPDWTLTLRQRDINTDGLIAPGDTGDALNAVSWSIEGEALAAPDSGTWEAAFYSNLSADQRTTADNNEDAVPTGIAGTFEAAYHHVGRIVGAFGAHKQP